MHAAARLNHQNIIAAYDADECELGHFLVMEFVDGSDLGQIVKKQGPLRTSAAIDCILQSARGLSYAHSQGVIHRDIKPANLMRDAGGVIRVADLGLAQLKETATGENLDDGLSVAGTMSGTVDYMPPEQAMDSSSVDERADIYSLGCTLFFLMTGKGMFAVGSSITRLMAHQSQPRPSISEIDRQWDGDRAYRATGPRHSCQMVISRPAGQDFIAPGNPRDSATPFFRSVSNR